MWSCIHLKREYAMKTKSRNKFEMKSTSFTERSHSDAFFVCLLACTRSLWRFCAAIGSACVVDWVSRFSCAQRGRAR